MNFRNIAIMAAMFVALCGFVDRDNYVMAQEPTIQLSSSDIKTCMSPIIEPNDLNVCD
jgi:hypothetical protein